MDTLTLTYWQRRRLEQQLLSTRDARVFRRTLAVLEVASGQSVGSVASRLRVTPRAVYHWLAAYARNRDPATLADGGRSGRPTLLDQPRRDLLLELLGKSPQELGYPDTTWTVPLLRRHLAHDLLLSEDTLRREIQRLRYSWKRPRYRLDPDPELRGKKDAHPQAHQAVATTERGPGAGRDGPVAVPAAAVLLVARGPAQGGPAERAQRPAGGVRGHEPADGLPAALAPRAATGGRLPGVPGRGAFLLPGLAGGDAAGRGPQPHGQGSVRLAEGFGMELLWLPKRCPELNPMDSLWGQAKDVVCADKQYPGLDEQVGRFIRHLESLSPRNALHTAGVLSDDFWLRDVL
jgi:transposase